MMYGSGFFGNNGCFGNGYGFMSSGWSMLITIGVILVVVAVIIYFARKGNSYSSTDSALKSLKMKYVQGEITEEEYTKRKNILGRK